MPVIPDVPPKLADAMACDPPKVVPLIGAGVSTALGFPDGPGLVRMFRDRAKTDGMTPEQQPNWELVEQHIIAGNIDKAAYVIRSKVGHDVYLRWVRRILSKWVPKESQAHVILNMLSFPFFLTTNYDRVLEATLVPPPEVLTHKDFKQALWFLKEGERFIMKLHGDITRAHDLLHGTIAQSVGKAETGSPKATEQAPLQDTVTVANLEAKTDFLNQIFSTYSVLFLGVLFSDENAYAATMRKVVTDLGEKAPQHYILMPVEGLTEQLKQDFLQKYNLVALTYTPTKGHSEVWQFLAKLRSDDVFTPTDGMPNGAFFSMARRPEYLDQQATLERGCGAMRFLTPHATNALSTPRFLEESAAKTLEGLFRYLPDDYDRDDWVKRVIKEMHKRREILDERLAAGCEVRILCELGAMQKQSDGASEHCISRYRWIIGLLKDMRYDLEVRITKGVFAQHGADSFGLALTPHPNGANIAVSYSTQATNDEFTVHIIQQNTDFASSRLLMFEQEWVRAETEAKSLDVLEQLYPVWRTPQDKPIAKFR